MSVKQRLKDFIKTLPVGETAFEKKVGISNGLISNIGYSISGKTLEKITSSYPDLNSAWLLTGEGEMLKNKKQKTDLPDEPVEDLLNDDEPAYDRNSNKIEPGQQSLQAIVNLTEANKLLAEAHKMFAQSQTKYAEANLKLAMNNEQLIELTKATVENGKHTQPAFDARYADLLELLADVAAGKRYKSKQEALALLSKQFYDDGVKKPAVDTQKN